MKKATFICFLVLLFFIFTKVAFAATYTCGTDGINNSCTVSGFKTMLANASPGDTIRIANGTHAWVTNASVKQPIIDKEITITGSGTYAVDASHNDIGTWPVTLDISVTQDWGSPPNHAALMINAPANTNIRITGIRFTGSTGGGGSRMGAINVFMNNATNNWRVDNSYFGNSGNAVDVEAGFGLIDHIYSYTSGCNPNGQIFISDMRNDADGDWSWAQDVTWGSADFVFLEDSTFWGECTGINNTRGAMDSNRGGRVVVRYNYFRDRETVFHGTENNSYANRGGQAAEIYNNTYYGSDSSTQWHTAMFARGGSWLVHNNTVTNYQSLWKTWVRRVEQTGGFGPCDGTSVSDGNWGGLYPPGYPCLGQIGVIKANGITYQTAQPQTIEPSRIWANTWSGSGGCGGVSRNSGATCHNNPDYVVDGRDYYYCTDGSCAPSGYTPYTYPHPLATSGVGDTQPPSGGDSGNDTSASGGSGCGFVKDDKGKGPRANGGGATFAIMLMIILTGIGLAKRLLTDD